MQKEQYQRFEITKDVWRIADDVVNIFLFIGDEYALLVDTGFGAGDLKNVVVSLTDKPVRLVNTHADRDHIGCNMQFETAGMHPSEFARYRAHVPGAPVCALREGDEIDIGGRCFEIVLIPGHTPGSIALLDRENRLLIAGDSVSTAPIFIFGEGRDLTAYRDSVGKLLGMRDRFDTVYASHGEAKIDPSIIEKLKDAAAKLDNGELTAQAPPFELPAKMYLDGGVGFFR